MSVNPKDAGLGRPDTSVAFELAASGWIAARASEAVSLRSRVAAAYPGTLSVSLLKHIEEQCLVALLVLRQLLDENRATITDGEQWGLVAAARALGRKRVAESLGKFCENGAWTTSPHLIPNCSLHTQSGVLSQALKLHGPNFGVGGMKGSEGEALNAAAAMLRGDRLPGVWIVLTAWEKESIAADDLTCQAAVLGLRPWTNQSHGKRLSFDPADPSGQRTFTLESVIESLRSGRWNAGATICTIESIAQGMEAAA